MQHLLPPLLPPRFFRKSVLASVLGGLVISTAVAHSVSPTEPLAAHVVAGGTVTGRVVDAKGEGIPGVTVIVEGTTLGASTDASGTYSIANVPAGSHTLIFSSIGLNSSRVTVSVSDGQTATVAAATKP